MSSQRYQRVNAHDEDETEAESPVSIPLQTPANAPPTSPPPSFHSRSSSLSSRRLLHEDPHAANEPDQALADAFDDGNESDESDEPDDRQRLMRAHPDPTGPISTFSTTSTSSSATDAHAELQGSHSVAVSSRRPAPVPAHASSTGPSRLATLPNDGVFANLAAKPERGEKTEDLPPSYEEAAADATPPYWETTIVAPGISSDEVYVDGLPVGSIFSFVWNAMISMSFQLVGFLLTYLLHTTHAAKNGSRAGLGLTLVQYGFYMKGGNDAPGGSDEGGTEQYVPPPDPNSHTFDPSTVADSAASAAAGAATSASGITTSEWISYVLMIVGWFILIRAVSDFMRARRHEQLVLQSPDRGLPVPVIAEGETTEAVV